MNDGQKNASFYIAESLQAYDASRAALDDVVDKNI